MDNLLKQVEQLDLECLFLHIGETLKMFHHCR